MASKRSLAVIFIASVIEILVVFVSGLTETETQKFGVSGNFLGASVAVEVLTDTIRITASGLPDHQTQTFNNNYPSAQNYNITIPRNPTHAAVPGCVGLGMIGIARTGVAIYNPLTGSNDNAVEGATQETFDFCDGHASPNGAYHYHKIPDSCVYRGEVDEFIGVAMDGFPIYGPRISATQNITEAELDKCHGKIVNGKYRYYVTDGFPYFLGCFKGVVINQGTMTQYNCSSDVSPWMRQSFSHDFYLCHCENSGMGGGGGGGGPRPECRPENPNRPSDCPDCSGSNPPPNCPSRPPMSQTHPYSTTPSPRPSSTTTMDNSSSEGLTSSEVSKFGTSGQYDATVSVSVVDYNYVISASGLPDHPTEKVNPNDPTAQNYVITIPQYPRHAPVPGCVGQGMIGITRTGVAIYNPLTGSYDNAVEGANREQFDSCDGHASPNGAYHYHKIPDSCLYKGEVEEFIGVALDGFPIYGPRVTSMTNVTEEELDKCHGKYVNGKYRYYVTEKFPYFLGCFKGVVINQNTRTVYNCSTDVSPWDRQSYSHDYYLCDCSNYDMGGGGGGTMPRPECRPDNPTRPNDCPSVSPMSSAPPTGVYGDPTGSANKLCGSILTLITGLSLIVKFIQNN